MRLLHIIQRRGATIASWCRLAFARASGVTAGSGTTVESGVELALGRGPARQGRLLLGSRNRVARGVILHPYGGSIETGIDVYLGPYTVIYGHGGVTIGKDTLVSMHCRILSSNHEIPPAGTIMRSRPDVVAPTRIGRDVWLGAGVTVLAGVTIGDGCVVGAGAVVTHDLPANTIAVGVPARVTGPRGQRPLP